MMIEQHDTRRWERHRPIPDVEIDEAFDRPSRMLLWLLPAMMIWALAIALIA